VAVGVVVSELLVRVAALVVPTAASAISQLHQAALSQSKLELLEVLALPALTLGSTVPTLLRPVWALKGAAVHQALPEAQAAHLAAASAQPRPVAATVERPPAPEALAVAALAGLTAQALLVLPQRPAQVETAALATTTPTVAGLAASALPAQLMLPTQAALEQRGHKPPTALRLARVVEAAAVSAPTILRELLVETTAVVEVVVVSSATLELAKPASS
jgi:hypothetical protein